MIADRFVCRIAWFKNQNKVFDLPNGNQANGNLIQIYDDLSDSNPSHENQKWLFDPIGNGYYVIALAKNKNKVLDLPNGNGANGTRIQLYDRLENDSQQWTLYFLNGVFAIEPKAAPGRVFDLAGGDPSNGNRVQSWQFVLNNDNQKWVLRFSQSPMAAGLSGTGKLILGICPDAKPGGPRNIVDAGCRTVQLLKDIRARDYPAIVKDLKNDLGPDVIAPDPGEPGGPPLWKDPAIFGNLPADQEHEQEQEQEHEQDQEQEQEQEQEHEQEQEQEHEQEEHEEDHEAGEHEGGGEGLAADGGGTHSASLKDRLCSSAESLLREREDSAKRRRKKRGS